MTVTFDSIAPDDALDERLRAELLETWVAVTNAGGAVGFTAPASLDDVANVLDNALSRVACGQDALGVLREGAEVVGMGLLVDRGTPTCLHWRTVLRVVVHPGHQGAGAGLTLMQGLHLLGRQIGLDHLQLTIRDGYGLERFYQRLGYTVVGRHPSAVRVAPGQRPRRDHARRRPELSVVEASQTGRGHGSTWGSLRCSRWGALE